MASNSEIIVVSGLPRSGTSLMMQMLEAGGVEVLSDHVRAADADNPRGYYETEKVKKIKQDAAWLPGARGKAVKMVSQLLYDLPSTESYKIIFMERDLDEVLLSQEKTLKRLNKTSAPREQIKESYSLHLDKLRKWLEGQENMSLLRVLYSDVMSNPGDQIRLIGTFLGRKLDRDKMATAIDSQLYRNRKSKTH